MTWGEHLDNAEARGYAEGRSKGLTEGRAAGLAEGRAEGEARGKLVGILETAKNFLKLGFPLEKVREATGLSLEELKALK